MERFLINMAIVKVNLDKKGADILDNYVHLITETLCNMDGDVFSVDEFKAKFIEIAEFKIPTGAILSLLKRATQKYQVLSKRNDGTYFIERDKIQKHEFKAIRDQEQRKYNGLVVKFTEYCKNHHNILIDEQDATKYFFEVLYDIAPLLFISMNNSDSVEDSHSDKNRYLVSKFVAHANKCDQISFDALLSFVKGSMLTETFYYSQNYTDITNKPLKRVVVYFDTIFLARALGLSQPELCIPSEELMEMLREMDVKTRCFRHTVEELKGILLAAFSQLNEHGRLNIDRPGDIFDFISQKDMKASDILILINSIENKLNKIGIYLEERPDILEAYSIDEHALSERLLSSFERQSEKARAHDVSCLQAIFQLREGQRQQYLDRCKAIFITTNAKLARQSTIFFNEQYGHSNAPICMSEYVFTSLVWMKSVKKINDIPKDRLVANCYSALLPSNSLWAEYIREVNKLKDSGEINENDYHVLIYSMIARDKLMDQAFTSNDNIFGSIPKILENAKKAYTDEIGEKLEATEATLEKQTKKIEGIIDGLRYLIEKTIFTSMASIWILLLLYMLIKTSPSSLPASLSEINNTNSVIFILFLFITVLNVVFGVRLIDHCKSISQKISAFITNKIKLILLS